MDNLRQSAQQCWTVWVSVVTATAQHLTPHGRGGRWGVVS